MANSRGPRGRLLRQLAQASGIQTSYRDLRGERVVSSDDTLLKLLGVLGIEATTDEAAANALAMLEQRHRTQIEPVLVHRIGSRAGIPIPPGIDKPGARLRITQDNGNQAELPLAEVIRTVSGSVTIRLDRLKLPMGYHQLEFEGNHSTMVIVAPGRAPVPQRSFGLFAPLYGLRSSRDWGVGSTSELDDLLRFAEVNGASFVGTLPLYASSYEQPLEPSPYRPISRLAWNEIYLDVTALPELAASEQARALLADGEFRARLESLRRSRSVDYASVYRAKREVLELVSTAVRSGPVRNEVRSFLRTNKELAAYARFRAAAEAPRRDRTSSVEFHEFVQFAMDRSLHAVAAEHRHTAQLYLDLPLGVHPDGFDRHHFHASFLSGSSIGAPPDLFLADGQNWNIPPLDPEGIRRDGYRYFAACLRKLFAVASTVRVDHVMGLERCYLVPEGNEPVDGAYLSYRSEELHAVLHVEAARRDGVVVGEDLGTVPDATRKAMQRDGMLHSYVYQFEASPADPVPRSPKDALASFGTHDLPRFRSWIRGSGLERADEQERDQELLRRESILDSLQRRSAGRRPYDAVLYALGRCEAALVVVDVGDLIGDAAPENEPGPESSARSWRHRLPWALERIASSKVVSRRLALLGPDRRQGEEPQLPER